MHAAQEQGTAGKVGSAPNETAAETSTNPYDTDSVEALLSRLDSPSFKDREAATEALIERGPEILKPLTIHFFNSSSEAGWRIHRILEGIGRNGNEEDFLKSIAIIQLLYGAQDSQSQRRLAKLQHQWQITRRAEAAKKLSRMGFKFSFRSGMQGQETALERARIEMMVRAAAVRELGGIEIATSAEPMRGTDNGQELADPKWENPRNDRLKSIMKIERIITGDANDSREIMKGLLPAHSQTTLSPGNLEIPEGFEGDEEALRLIDDLGALSTLSFRKQQIDASIKNFISRQRFLNGLEFIDCDFGDDSKSLSFPASIANLGFEGSMPPAAAFRSVGQISALRLSKLKLDADTAAAISRCRVQTIALDEVEFSKASIQKLVSITGLFRVTMSLCKFELEWLEDIRKRNPNLISASPKAFLGVQGPIDIGGGDFTGCQISQVVAGTAAADAGMQPLDIVTKMDGTKISQFEDLRLLISQKRPGETMELEVRRGERTIDLKVRLGQMTPTR
ncbi:PDZ domain-containing protein [Mariniblastus fucicola]|uniref:PDZ domain-containing protein n=1 Tax=Mariniblastus fucicola TaxID=980251 RepID=UPI0012FCA76D|nr:PDZ domain-containing protein [Mariniblastus fucicola]